MRENRDSGFLTRSDTNRPEQSWEKGRSLKVRIYEAKGLYYLCREIKAMISYCTADLLACFHIGKNGATHGNMGFFFAFKVAYRESIDLLDLHCCCSHLTKKVTP